MTGSRTFGAEREACANDEAAARLPAALEDAADDRDALAHAQEPVAAGPFGLSRRTIQLVERGGSFNYEGARGHVVSTPRASGNLTDDVIHLLP